MQRVPGLILAFYFDHFKCDDKVADAFGIPNSPREPNIAIALFLNSINIVIVYHSSCWAIDKVCCQYFITLLSLAISNCQWAIFEHFSNAPKPDT